MGLHLQTKNRGTAKSDSSFCPGLEVSSEKNSSRTRSSSIESESCPSDNVTKKTVTREGDSI